MNKLTIWLIALYGFTASAQSLLKYKDEGHSLSPSETRYNQFHFYSENRMLRTLFAHPVMEHVVAQDSLYESALRSSYVGVNYAAADLPHDFHIFEGNAFQNYSVNASGVVSPKGVGTLYGSIEYARGEDQGIGWSAIRHYDIFTPFLSTDSIGGDSKWDMYTLRGGYAFSLNRFNLGAEFSYKGEQAYRLTDPRLINTTSWVDFTTSASYRFDRSIVMLSVGYERTKQYQTERYWMPGLQDRFFLTYGFGMYNDMYSRVSFGYSRMSYIQGLKLRAAYVHDFGSHSRLTASMGLYNNELKTEETSIINLYRSTSTELTPSVEYQTKCGDFDLLLTAEANIRLRTGYENIYDQVLIDEANNIYDYRLISTRQNYNASNAAALLQAKPSYRFNAVHKLSLMGGAYFFQREEEYKAKTHHLLNQWIEPHVGLGYTYEHGASLIDVSLLYSRKISTDNIYKVNLTSTDKIQYLDFQQAFSPYAFYANEYDALRIHASYVHDLKKLSIGLRAEALLKNGHRLDDVRYDGRIGFASSAPTPTTNPDSFIEQWGKISLFVMF